MKGRLILAIDFDGTCVEHKFPEIGEPLPESFETLKEFIQAGDRLILWTWREGVFLQEAIDFCREHGVEFESHNKNVIEHNYDKSRKVYADMYIDDRMPGGFPGWNFVKQEVEKLRNHFSNF